MPYLGEFAKVQGNQKAMNEMQLNEIFKQVHLVKKEPDFIRLDDYIVKDTPKPLDTKIKYIFVIDGSKYDSNLNNYLSLGLVNVNECVVDMKKMMDYLNKSFPLPREYEDIKEDIVSSFLFPLKGMATGEYSDEKDVFRSFIYQMMKSHDNPAISWIKNKGYKLIKTESLLDTYISLFDYKPQLPNNIHPCPICKKSGRTINFKNFLDEGQVKESVLCKCGEKTVYITDLLQFYEQLNNAPSLEALTTQIMLVLEKLLLINLLRNIHINQLYSLINESVFIMDGSLALYSHASWLSQSINQFLLEFKENSQLLLLGIEKTGNFVEHFKFINNHFNESPLQSKMLFFLNDDYIKKHIKLYDNDSFYGEKNYFGKKLFYKNAHGKLFVVNVAFENEAERSVLYNDRNNPETIGNTTRLKDISMILEYFYSQSYDNALSLLSLANDGVSLSSSPMSRKLLDETIENLLKDKAQ